MTQKPDTTRRNYSFSDAYLAERSDSLVVSLNNDQALLAQYNVPAARITALTALRNAFTTISGDELYMGGAMLKRGIRDDKYALLYAEMQNLVIKVKQNVWATKVDMLDAFALQGGLSGLTHLELLQRARVCKDALTTYQASFAAAYLINAAYITTFGTMLTDLDNAITDYETAKNLRSTKKKERITAGNNLYAEMLLLAEIGQNYWGGTGNNDAKYNEYVINENAPAPVQNITKTINAGQTIEITELTGIVTDTSMLFDTLTSALPGGLLHIWWGDNMAETPAPPYHFELPAGSPPVNHIAGDFGYDNVINTHLYVRNAGTDAAALHVQVNP